MNFNIHNPKWEIAVKAISANNFDEFNRLYSVHRYYEEVMQFASFLTAVKLNPHYRCIFNRELHAIGW